MFTQNILYVDLFLLVAACSDVQLDQRLAYRKPLHRRGSLVVLRAWVARLIAFVSKTRPLCLEEKVARSIATTDDHSIVRDWGCRCDALLYDGT